MPPTQTVKPDGPKIRELIRQWAKAREVRGEIKPFARKLGRPPDSILNVTSRGSDTSKPFIRQIAGALGVKPSEISDMPPEEDDISDWAGDDDTGSEPEP
jgi:hypothetical protein